MDKRCEACAFWVRNDVDMLSRGDCKRFPPIPVNNTGGCSVATKFPETHRSEWCGEFQPTDQPAEGA